MRRPLWMFSSCVFVIAVACGDDDVAPDAAAPIPLPERDASTPVEVDSGTTCDTQKDPLNCGACGRVCPTGPKGVASCSSGNCVLSCESGWGDCNGNVLDGCETDVTSATDHCGACDRDCRTCGGTTCSQSKCDAASYATAEGAITLMTVDADHVTYATATEVRQITREGLKDDSVYTVASTPWLAATKTNVQFVLPGTDAFAGIYSTSPGFVGPQIAAYARGENVDTFAIDETGAYYASQKKDVTARQLLRCNGCSVPTVLSGTENRFNPGSIALDGNTVFFGTADMIRRVEKTADNLKTIAVGQSARAMQVDADYIYWINEETSDVSRIPKAGGTAVEKIATGFETPRWLLLSNNRLYIGDAQAVSRMEKDGSARLELVRAPGPIGVDGQCVFVAAGTAVRRVTP